MSRERSIDALLFVDVVATPLFRGETNIFFSVPEDRPRFLSVRATRLAPLRVINFPDVQISLRELISLEVASELHNY
jgi:hypothetical protein